MLYNKIPEDHDSETGFYYLQSRYYAPIVKRFFNADSYASTGQGFLGYNMYAYCGNNPVNANDPTGQVNTWNYSCTDGGENHDKENYITNFQIIESRRRTGYYESNNKSTLDAIIDFIINDDPMACRMPFFSMYKGAPVLNIHWDWARGKLTSFSFGVIVMLNMDTSPDADYEKTLRHERGHSTQME